MHTRSQRTPRRTAGSSPNSLPERGGRRAQVGGKPDFADPVVLSADRGGTKVESLCGQIHKTLAADFLYALVWGTSSKHYPQRRAPALLAHLLTPRRPAQSVACGAPTRGPVASALS